MSGKSGEIENFTKKIDGWKKKKNLEARQLTRFKIEAFFLGSPQNWGTIFDIRVLKIQYGT